MKLPPPAKPALIVLVMVLTVATSRGALTISGLYNTGVDRDTRGALAAGSKELTYQLTGPENQAYVELVVYHNHDLNNQAWVTPPAGSAWIGPNDIPDTYPDDPVGDYHYVINFNLSGAADISKVRILGSWATDNEAQWWLNGVYTGFSKSPFGFSQLNSFGLQGGLVNGLNTLEFWVRNSGGPSGLLVANLQITEDASLTLPTAPPVNASNAPWSVTQTTPVPEPSTLIAGALLLVPIGVQGIRHLQSRKSQVWITRRKSNGSGADYPPQM